MCNSHLHVIGSERNVTPGEEGTLSESEILFKLSNEGKYSLAFVSKVQNLFDRT